MATLYTHRDSNVWRTWLLLTGFLVVVIGLGFVFGRIYNNPIILYVAVGFSLLMNITSYWYSDKIALASTGAKPLDRGASVGSEDIHDLVENLAITAGLPMPRIYIINDPAPNAFATGRNANNAAIALTTGLIERLNKTELEGVIAHELAHIGNRDILLSTVVVVLVGFVAILSDIFLRSHMFGGRNNDNKGGNILFIVGIVLAILTPIIATIIQLAISRKREFLADATGGLLTRYPEGLASALEKISSYSAPMQKASNATAHMFISNPFGGQAMKGLHKLFLTHPPVEERVAALRGE